MPWAEKTVLPQNQTERDQLAPIVALANNNNMVRIGEDIWTRQADGSYKNTASYQGGSYKEYGEEDQIKKSKKQLYGIMKRSRFSPPDSWFEPRTKSTKGAYVDHDGYSPTPLVYQPLNFDFSNPK